MHAAALTFQYGSFKAFIRTLTAFLLVSWELSLPIAQILIALTFESPYALSACLIKESTQYYPSGKPI